ncbi:MAG: PKD domain-containing protein [Gemmatimonadota bacterium]
MPVKPVIVLGVLSFALWGCSESRNPTSLGDPSTATAFLANAPAGVPVYRVTAINASVGLRVNQSGDVAGWSTTYPYQPILYTAETGVIVLPTSTGTPSGVARDLSDRVAGVVTVVGEAKLNTSGGAIHAVRWRVAVPQGTVISTTDLGTLPGHSESAAYGVNSAGQIVGTSDPNSALSIRSFIYSSTTGMVDLGLGSVGTNARALDINASGVVTGYLGLQAFRWTTTGGLQNLGAPAGWPNAFGNAINASNQVAASATDAFGNASTVVRYTSGTGWQVLGGMGQSNNAGPNSGNGIDQWGDVVGLGWPRTGSTPAMKAVFYSDNLGLLAYVDDLLEVPGSWLVKNAFDINDAQQITGYAYNAQTAVTSAVLLTPVTPSPPNQPPVANFSYFCNGFFQCGMDGSLSTDDHGIILWSWSVNNQVVSTGKFGNIQFNGPQTVNVTLTVTDTRGVSTSITNPVVVGGGVNQPPVANFTVTCTPGKCVLDASSSTDDNGVVGYGWQASIASRGAKAGVQITRKWLAAGGNSYKETLTVTDGSGLTNVLTRKITIPHP